MSKTCSCCPNKAKYDVDGELCCGKHLTYTVDYALKMSPHQVKVEKVKEQYDE